MEGILCRRLETAEIAREAAFVQTELRNSRLIVVKTVLTVFCTSF